MSKFEELVQENLRLKAIVMRGHDSHDCPNGTWDDGHCENCLDPYWQVQGRKLEKEKDAWQAREKRLRALVDKFHSLERVYDNVSNSTGSSYRYCAEKLQEILDS